VTAFLRHLLERVDWKHDLHFQTATTIDTLDYSGTSLNEGSKVVMAAVGPSRRLLPSIPPVPLKLPDGFAKPRGVLHGILAIQAPPYQLDEFRRVADPSQHPSLVVQRFCDQFKPTDLVNNFPLIVLVDDSEFTAKSLANFVWVTFTRSNPAVDIHGIGAFMKDKHFGCEGSLVIDARTKPHHAPVLEEDPEISKRVDALGASGGPLHGII
jgi:4-hydroxy-3-polyprenylbenzoate decarboxylase